MIPTTRMRIMKRRARALCSTRVLLGMGGAGGTSADLVLLSTSSRVSMWPFRFPKFSSCEGKMSLFRQWKKHVWTTLIFNSFYFFPFLKHAMCTIPDIYWALFKKKTVTSFLSSYSKCHNGSLRFWAHTSTTRKYFYLFLMVLHWILLWFEPGGETTC